MGILEEPTDDILERIADAGWNYIRGGNNNGICVTDRYTINACNHIYSGTVEYEGQSYGFQIESGDNNGTVIHAWGLEDDVGTFNPPPPPEPMTFVPNNRDLFQSRPEMFDVYCYWRNQQWFKDKAQGYNYDRHFAPGCKTEEYYRKWAETKGLKVGWLSNFTAEEQARIKELTK